MVRTLLACVSPLLTSERRYATTSELYRQLLGILHVKTVGDDPARPSEVQITFDLGDSRTATLAVEFDIVAGRGRRLAGAHVRPLLHSLLSKR